MTINRIILLLFLALSMTGCSSLGSGDPTKSWPASKLYSEAKDALDSGNYIRAIELFETLEARFPFGRFAQQAQLDTAYAYHKNEEPDSAIAAADRFIKLHPRNPHIDYAYYLKGLSNFNRGKNILSAIVQRDPSTKDTAPLKRAFEDFNIILKNHPNSRYAEDSRKRMVFLRNNLAEHEMKIADYYIRRGAYIGAANRAKYVLTNYQGAAAMPQALKTMIQAYRKLELNDLAEDAYQVLKTNYPEQAKDIAI